MKKQLSYFLASLFGVGFIKKAPGTFGSFASFALIIPVAYFYKTTGIIALTLASFIIGYFATREVLKYTKHDPSFVVIDELCGQSITFLFVANLLNLNSYLLYILGFILFRLFDITKPLFIGWADKKIENSLGVMLDDLFAGLSASVILWLITFFI